MISSERELQAFQQLLSNFKVDKILVNTTNFKQENKDILNRHFDNITHWLKEEIDNYERLCVEQQNQRAIENQQQNQQATKALAPSST